MPFLFQIYVEKKMTNMRSGFNTTRFKRTAVFLGRPSLRTTDLFRSQISRTIDQKILMTLPLPFFDLRSSLEVVWMSSESYPSSFRPLIFLPFCFFLFSVLAISLIGWKSPLICFLQPACDNFEIRNTFTKHHCTVNVRKA